MKITIDLSKSGSIQKLKNELEKSYEELYRKLKLFGEKLAEKGVEFAQDGLLDMNAVFKGELWNSIDKHLVTETKDTVVFCVKADSDHAIFVEMGTGMVGATSPYIGNLPAVYAQGKTMFETKDGTYGWYFPLDDGTWRFTQGMPSRPFMHNASVKMMEIVQETAREVFG